jgi:hypothetical protein
MDDLTVAIIARTSQVPQSGLAQKPVSRAAEALRSEARSRLADALSSIANHANHPA